MTSSPRSASPTRSSSNHRRANPANRSRTYCTTPSPFVRRAAAASVRAITRSTPSQRAKICGNRTGLTLYATHGYNQKCARITCCDSTRFRADRQPKSPRAARLRTISLAPSEHSDAQKIFSAARSSFRPRRKLFHREPNRSLARFVPFQANRRANLR